MTEAIKNLMEQVHQEIKPILELRENYLNHFLFAEYSTDTSATDNSKYIKSFPVIEPKEDETEFLMPRKQTKAIGKFWNL